MIILGTTKVGIDKPEYLGLGIRAENIVHAWVFDVTYFIDRYGDGTPVLYNKGAGDMVAYPCLIERSENLVTWILRDVDLAYKGVGECEIFWLVGEGIAKTEVYKTVTIKDIGIQGDLPDPWSDYLDEMAQLALQTKNDADRAEAAVQDLKDLSVEVNTLPEGSDATADYANDVLTLGIPRGNTGNGIVSITKIATQGLIDTYRILFTDGNHTDFQITNGRANSISATEDHGIVEISLI